MSKDPLSKNDLIKLYKSGMSMSEMAKYLTCSQNKVVYWMKKHKIKRRDRSEASYIKQNPDGDPFKIKSPLTNYEYFLLGLGLGIYWGEGTKASIHSVRVTNTDYKMIISFIEFLEKICQVKKEKISYSLVCFNDADPKISRDYWSKKLKISPKKFGKITSIPSRGKGTYKKKSMHGVCSVHFGNIKLKKWIDKQVKNIHQPG